METELDKLIQRIKKEGVEEAEKGAADVISRADQKAREIIKDAEKRKADITKEAEAESQKFREASERALKRASRDVLLTLRERVIEFFDRLVKDKTSKELTPNILKNVIVEAVENFTKEGVLDIEVLVSEDDRKRLEKSLFSALRQEVKGRVKLTGKKGIEKGFRIGEKGKDSYFDFTDEAIAEALKRYLNPRLVEMLDIDLGLGKGKKSG